MVWGVLHRPLDGKGPGGKGRAITGKSPWQREKAGKVTGGESKNITKGFKADRGEGNWPKGNQAKSVVHLHKKRQCDG